MLRRADLVVLQVSDNSAAQLGLRPEEILGHRVAVVVGAERAAQLEGVVARERIEKSPRHVFTLPDLPAADRRGPLEALVHAVDGVVVLELERAERGLEKPDLYALVKATIGRLEIATSLRSFCQIAAEELRISPAWIASWSTASTRTSAARSSPRPGGRISRRTSGSATRPTTSPARARDLREDLDPPGPRRDGAAERAYAARQPGHRRALDMTYCALRGTSVMYTEYLANMAWPPRSRSPFTAKEALGLLACHHGAPFPMAYPVRAACELLAQVVSLQLATVEQREHLEYRLQISETVRRLVDRAAREGGLSILASGSPSLLDMVRCDGAAVFHRGQWWTVGRAPADEALDALAVWLRRRAAAERRLEVVAVDRLAREYPPGEALTATASGLLAAPLARDGRHFIVWFRGEARRTVSWGGDPRAKPIVEGLARAAPHAAPIVRDLERAGAGGLRALGGDRDRDRRGAQASLMEVVVSRAESLAALNADLARSNAELDTFAHLASHDLASAPRPP